jgi:transcriptional regulator with GAF, ATPase, and Fis domain
MSGFGSPKQHREFVGVASLEYGARPKSVMIGQSAAWREVLKSATRVAPLETTICLHGESGTGKEVLARFIHRNSSRRSGPFVAINCAALPEQLLESELFGFERGAFTSAYQAKAGQFELAAGGVLFLDEITEMTPAAQAKILRVLQEREFQRLGGTRLLRANARVIVATNRDLQTAVSRGAFREDLYYRVNVFEIRIPPLRERREDILPFARSFLQEFGSINGLPAIGLTPEAAEVLVAHKWPGNVRELRNVIERATIVCDGGVIRDSDLALAPSCASSPDITDLGHLEERAIERAIREAGGNRSRAARQLGISRTQLYGRLRKYGFEGVGR